MNKRIQWKGVALLGLAGLLSLVWPHGTYAQEGQDIQGHWAELNMVRGMELGFLQGYQGRLRPNDPVSRAEFIAMVTRDLNPQLEDQTKMSQYTDIGQVGWAEASLKKAEALGLLDWVYPGKTIAGNQKITRQEAGALLDHALLLKNQEEKGRLNEASIKDIHDLLISRVQNQTSNNGLNFKDSNQVDQRFLPSLVNLIQGNILAGDDKNCLNPKGDMTRSEGISLILRAKGQEARPIQVGAVQVVSENGKKFLVNPSNQERILRSQVKGGLLKAGNQSYLLQLDSSLASGFIQEGKKTFYVQEDKGLAKGWAPINGKYYYFSPVDSRMYKGGIFSTGDGVYWFGEDGQVKTGKRPGGRYGKMISWSGPSEKDYANTWLEGNQKDLRFRGQEMVNFAMAYEGRPFKWFGTDLRDPSGVYCCGTTYSTHKEFGIHIPGPKDVDMKKHKGYEMVRAQYQDAEKYGGIYIPNDYSKAWPGDLMFYYRPNFYLGFNHVSLFVGHNGGRPMYVHATLFGGLIVEDANSMIRERNYRINDQFVRYNTEKNPGTGKLPNY